MRCFSGAVVKVAPKAEFHHGERNPEDRVQRRASEPDSVNALPVSCQAPFRGEKRARHAPPHALSSCPDTIASLRGSEEMASNGRAVSDDFGNQPPTVRDTFRAQISSEGAITGSALLSIGFRSAPLNPVLSSCLHERMPGTPTRGSAFHNRKGPRTSRDARHLRWTRCSYRPGAFYRLGSPGALPVRMPGTFSRRKESQAPPLSAVLSRVYSGVDQPCDGNQKLKTKN